MCNLHSSTEEDTELNTAHNLQSWRSAVLSNKTRGSDNGANKLEVKNSMGGI